MSVGDYETDRAWSDQWLPRLRALIGPYLLGPSTFDQDTKQCADLVVLSAKDMKIGCRVRRQFCADGRIYAEAYPDQFTIRSGRSNGVQTELAKILEGWGDWFFYGHDNGRHRIDPWWLINLTIFRRGVAEAPNSDDVRWDLITDIPNRRDGTFFHAYPIDLFPPSMLIADSVRHQQWAQGLATPRARAVSSQRVPWTPVGPLPDKRGRLF